MSYDATHTSVAGQDASRGTPQPSSTRCQWHAARHGATICYLQDVLVHPDARRLGVGSRLVEAVFAPYAQVRQQVLVTDDEPGQKAFYEALGFLDYAATFSGRTFVRFAR